ncbi:MAG: VOC family protein [Myxococcales bacterium]|nr:VOC family protein [Myxococcales bacterium]MCB9547247.1 VOC family protein [Myxococcales bacterium]
MIKHLDHLNLTVADLDASRAWYTALFDFQPVEGGVWRGHRWAILRAGDALLCLYEHRELESPAAATCHHLSHFALRLIEPAAFLDRVASNGVEVKFGGPVRWPGSTSWYVDDPTGHEIEVVCWDGDTLSFPAA